MPLRQVKTIVSFSKQTNSCSIHQQMLEYFGRNSYYRFLRKERLISPSEQKYIRQLFRKRGIEDEPVYDEYLERYEW